MSTVPVQTEDNPSFILGERLDYFLTLLSWAVYGLPLNFLIIVMGLRHRNLREGFMETVLWMIFYQFVNNLLVCLGSIVYWFGTIFQLSVTPRLCTYVRSIFYQLFKFSGLILAIDRYLSLCYNYHLTRRTTSSAFLLSFLFAAVYEYGTIPLSTFTPKPTANCHETYSPSILDVLSFLDPVCTTLAFFIDLRTLLFLYSVIRNNRGRRTSTRDENFAVIGLTIQAAMPVFISLPHQLANIFKSFDLKPSFYLTLSYISYFEAPFAAITTLIFIGPYRRAFMKDVMRVRNCLKPRSNSVQELNIQSISR